MANTVRRWVEFFEEFVLLEPGTTNPLLDRVTNNPIRFTNETFLTKLMGNPLWAEGYAQAKAQDNISAAFEKARSSNEGGYWVSEDDWKYMKKAAEEPRFLFAKNDMTIIQTGFGYHPSMSRQFVRAQETVIEAKTEADKEKFDAELAKVRAKAAAPAQATA